MCNNNVNVVETNYIAAQKYLAMRGSSSFHWLIVLFTVTTPTSAHMKDKNDTFTARGEDMIKVFVRRKIPVFHFMILPSCLPCAVLTKP